MLCGAHCLDLSAPCSLHVQYQFSLEPVALGREHHYRWRQIIEEDSYILFLRRHMELTSGKNCAIFVLGLGPLRCKMFHATWCSLLFLSCLCFVLCYVTLTLVQVSVSDTGAERWTWGPIFSGTALQLIYNNIFLKIFCI